MDRLLVWNVDPKNKFNVPLVMPFRRGRSFFADFSSMIDEIRVGVFANTA